jgi:hypothetical protein
LGLHECVQHELLHTYPVLSEKKGEFVAQFKYTVAIKENGPYLISGLKLDTSKFASDYSLTEESVTKVLAESWDNYVPNSKKDVKITKKEKKKPEEPKKKD